MTDLHKENVKKALSLISKMMEDAKGMNSHFKVEGCIVHRLFGEDGRMKSEGFVKNLVVSVGDRWVAEMVSLTAGNSAGNARLDVHSTAPAKGDTDVASGLANSNKTPEATYPKYMNSFGTGAGAWCVWRFSWGAGSGTSNSLSGVGLFSDSSATNAGSMFSRANFAALIAKGASDTLQVDWGWKFTGA